MTKIVATTTKPTTTTTQKKEERRRKWWLGSPSFSATSAQIEVLRASRLLLL
jgi:hypothetical protein